MMRAWSFWMGVLLLVPWVGAAETVSSPEVPPGYYSGDPLPSSTIYLTFDDGPSPETNSVLDLLAQKGVKATFFINAFNRQASPQTMGKENNLLRYKEVLQRMVAEGHTIGNHTFSHRDLATLKPAQIAWQLDTVQKDLDEALGPLSPQLRLIRPPFGSPWIGHWNTPEQRRRVAAVVATRGFVMNWTRSWDSSDSIDWAQGEKERLANPQALPTKELQKKDEREIARLLAHADGVTSAVILFHDTHPTVLDVLGPVIDRYRSLGYRFATLDEYARERWGSPEDQSRRVGPNTSP